MARPLARIPGARRVPQLAGRVRDDVALFDSWAGQYSDSPRAISDELHRREPGMRQAWVLSDRARKDAPEWVEPVTPSSREHLAHLGRAGVLVANNTVPGYYVKRRGQTFMQTWHGTPLKRIGLDIEEPSFGRPKQYRRTLAHNAARWDMLLSPNAFSTPIFRRAFGFQGPIFETGYPRNDRLLSADGQSIRLRVREQLEIAPDQTAILYAPTFRDGQPFAGHERLGSLGRKLGDGFALMVRAHSIDVLGEASASDSTDIRDVSGHQEVGELYLAADVLVTDYSSVMFDFAVTGKPLVFFTYDLDEYRDRLRGFYFDFEREAPGPLVASSDELLDVLRDHGELERRHADSYARFRERFCALEDGGASRRAVDILLAHG